MIQCLTSKASVQQGCFLVKCKTKYGQTCVQRPPLGLKKVAVIQKWSIFRGWSLKITINIKKLGISLLQTGGRCSEVVVNRGLIVVI